VEAALTLGAEHALVVEFEDDLCNLHGRALLTAGRERRADRVEHGHVPVGERV
jgi:hypothetical protein